MSDNYHKKRSCITDCKYQTNYIKNGVIKETVDKPRHAADNTDYNAGPHRDGCEVVDFYHRITKML